MKVLRASSGRFGIDEHFVGPVGTGRIAHGWFSQVLERGGRQGGRYVSRVLGDKDESSLRAILQERKVLDCGAVNLRNFTVFTMLSRIALALC